MAKEKEFYWCPECKKEIRVENWEKHFTKGTKCFDTYVEKAISRSRSSQFDSTEAWRIKSDRGAR